MATYISSDIAESILNLIMWPVNYFTAERHVWSLRSNSPEVRAASVDALVGIGNLSIGPLMRLVEENDMPWNSEQTSSIVSAITALGRLKAERATSLLIHALENGNQQTRNAAKDALINIGSATIKPLIRLLYASNPVVFTYVLEVLSKLKAQEAIEPAVQKLQENYSHYSRYPDLLRSVINSLAEFGEPSAQPIIRLLAGNSESQYIRYDDRKYFKDALVKIGEPAIDHLTYILHWCLFGEDFGIRLCSDAIDVLVQLKTEKAIEPLLRIIKEEHHFLRHEAAHALGELKAEIAVIPLSKLLYEDDIGLPRTAAEALIKINPEKAADILTEALVYRAEIYKERWDLYLKWTRGSDCYPGLLSYYWYACKDIEESLITLGAIARQKIEQALEEGRIPYNYGVQILRAITEQSSDDSTGRRQTSPGGINTDKPSANYRADFKAIETARNVQVSVCSRNRLQKTPMF